MENSKRGNEPQRSIQECVMMYLPIWNLFSSRHRLHSTDFPFICTIWFIVARENRQVALQDTVLISNLATVQKLYI